MRLGILCPTTCVGLGYGRPATSRRSFSRHHRITPTSHPKMVIIPPHIKPPGFTWAVSYTVKRGYPSPREGFHCASLHTLAYQESLSPNQNHNQTPKSVQPCSWRGLVPFSQHLTVTSRYRNINRLPIDYACRPRLRTRLTQGGLA